MSTTTRILIVLTSHSTLGSIGEPTGFWLEELTTPYYVFADAGAHVDIVSIAGGRAPLDPRSLKPAGENPASVERYLRDPSLQATLATTRSVDSVGSAMYDIVFLPGGHGTMWDFPTSAALGRVVVETLVRGAVVSAVCHGPAGLVPVTLPNGRPVVEGRRITAFTDSEERAAALTHIVPFPLETRLRGLGAQFESGADFKPFAIADGNLVTGQNPASSERVAELALAANKQRASARRE
jgi:putative intracellular protease/amidase